MSGHQILQRRSQNSGKRVAVMLIKFCVFHRNDRIDQIRRQLIVGNGFAVLDVDLAEDFVVSIQDHTRRFHLLELAQIERGRLVLQVGQIH